MAEMDFPHLRSVLKELGDEIGRNYASVLGQHGRNTTQRTLARSAEDSALHKVVAESDGYTVTFDLPTYWKYVENGTRPHWPPKAAIDRWIEIKPVIPRPGRDGRIPSPASLSYLIRRKIATVGTEGTHDLRAAREHTLPWWYDRIKEAMLQDVADQFADTILKVGGGKVIEFPL